MEKKTYVIFVFGEPFSFYLCLLEDLPQEERLFLQNYVDHYIKPSQYFAESLRLDSINNAFQSLNFFESYHDGSTFPFRGKGSMLCAIAQITNKNLNCLHFRVSLDKVIAEKDIISAFVERDLIEL